MVQPPSNRIWQRKHPHTIIDLTVSEFHQKLRESQEIETVLKIIVKMIRITTQKVQTERLIITSERFFFKNLTSTRNDNLQPISVSEYEICLSIVAIVNIELL